MQTRAEAAYRVPLPQAVTRGLAPFLLAFLVAALLIWWDWGQPWSAAAAVAGYSLWLWMARTRRYLPLTGEIRDSPYFLGFMLTLLALLVAFTAGAQPDGQLNPRYVVATLGSAITTTLVGLAARYVLQLSDDEELIQKQAFTDLQDELQRNVVAFRQSQRELLESIGLQRSREMTRACSPRLDHLD